MSKTFAVAGARLGYLATSPQVTDALRLVRLPYHLSTITQAAAIAALDHVDMLLATVDEIRTQRDRIVKELKQLGLKPAVSVSNFVFLDRKSTRLNSSHVSISYAVFCLKKKR